MLGAFMFSVIVLPTIGGTHRIGSGVGYLYGLRVLGLCKSTVDLALSNQISCRGTL